MLCGSRYRQTYAHVPPLLEGRLAESTMKRNVFRIGMKACRTTL